jgi:hypothetical protein
VSQQNRDTYEICIALADELVSQKRPQEAWAVLNALQAYVDVLPASSDGSCRKSVEKKLRDVTDALRAAAPRRALG